MKLYIAAPTSEPVSLPTSVSLVVKRKGASIYRIAIRYMQSRFRASCDSKLSPYWNKRSLRFLRSWALTVIEVAITERAEELYHRDYPKADKFGVWYYMDKGLRTRYERHARNELELTMTRDEVVELIDEEIYCAYS